MPSYGMDPAIYVPLEERCRDVLGADRFESLAEQGAVLTHAQLLDLIEARVGEATSSGLRSGPRSS